MGRIETTVPHLGAYITGGLVEWGRLLLLLDVRHGARIASGVSPARRITLHHVTKLQAHVMHGHGLQHSELGGEDGSLRMAHHRSSHGV